jgi:aminoglycoside phosphotransferase family enzyme
MIQEQINSLLLEGEFPEVSAEKELIETHISWVLICHRFVYKIKKPIKYSFLDFSTLEKRKKYCKREIELNKRLTDDIYLDVVPIYRLNDHYKIGGNEGTVVDYAVRMLKMDRAKQMDQLLVQNKVTRSDIQNLAKKIAVFHGNTIIIYQKDVLDIQEDFNDLEGEKEYLARQTNGSKYATIIESAIKASNDFLKRNKDLLAGRLRAGFFRDCHGDLHSRNIFLLPSPQPFDCIEFNDDFRQIDVLNEVAFLCMDLDAFGKNDLSELFLEYYNQFFPTMKSSKERYLFVFYKAYRANVRAKVNSLRAKSAVNKKERTKALSEVEKYLRLMESYLKTLSL